MAEESRKVKQSERMCPPGELGDEHPQTWEDTQQGHNHHSIGSLSEQDAVSTGKSAVTAGRTKSTNNTITSGNLSILECRQKGGGNVLV